MEKTLASRIWTWLRYNRFSWWLKDTLFDLKMGFQKITRGYSDSEIWNLDMTILKFVGTRVKVLRKITHGYPPDVQSFEEWLAILDDIAFACDMYRDFSEYTNIQSQEDYDMFASVYRDISDSLNAGEKSCPYTYSDCVRANKGLSYLKKYLLCLWD